MQQKLKLNLGCGQDLRPGWVNIDAVADFKPDLVHDLSKPLPFAPGSAIEIVAQDILEHFTFEEVDFLIAEISRVLDIGGHVLVRVPDVDQIVIQFEKTPWVRNLFLYGDTAKTGVFGAHKMGFTPQVLLFKFMKHQLFPVSLCRVQTNSEATFVRKKIVTPHWQSEVMSLAADSLIEQVKRLNRADVAVIKEFWSKIIFTPLAYLQQKPVVWMEANNFKYLTRYFRLPKLLYRLVKNIPTMIILPNKEILNEFLTTTRVDQEKIRIMNERQIKTEWSELLNEVMLRKQVGDWLKKHRRQP